MVEIKSAAEMEAMREAGRVVAGAPAAVRGHAAVGVSLLELNEVAGAVMADAGAKPAFLHYKPAFAPTPFPAVICASGNEVIVHGIPHRDRAPRAHPAVTRRRPGKSPCRAARRRPGRCLARAGGDPVGFPPGAGEPTG
ncbi:M24 family metallopeptidase [Streptosporangium roseum]|uniref:M24 family metallopeptidase n=1 Tax=Streptosporangium roseum TaxID=2001 RepID=UPI0004CCA6FB|nr:M24 family metallopeptidase [Streptosporangium roseum]